MKKLIISSFLFALLFSSCSKEEMPTEEQQEKTVIEEVNLEVEEYILRAMDDWYLYEAEVPELGDSYFSTDEKQYEYLVGFESPEALFEDLQASHDRFSFMMNDYSELEKMIYSGVEKTNGMIYSLGKFSGSDNVWGIVRYVLPGSSAEQQGVERGDAFMKIDGQAMTVQNYRDLLAPDSYSVQIAEINNYEISETDKVVNLTKVERAENPVFLSKVLEIEGKNIGYLVYNGFTMDFDSQLNEAFAGLKAAGIDELVLDLRYNSGGSIETAVDLASMITGQFEGQVMAQTMLNKKWQDIYDREAPDALLYKFNSEIRTEEQINSLNLNKVYVLATGSSASASELLINGLQAYIDVIHIGTNTAGKYQGSRTLYDSDDMFFGKKNVNPNHKYAIQPLISKVANANGKGDYSEGLPPDILLEENYNDFGVLGDPSETMLKAAINDIFGKQQEEVATSVKRAQEKFKIIGESKMFSPTYQRMYMNELPDIQ